MLFVGLVEMLWLLRVCASRLVMLNYFSFSYVFLTLHGGYIPSHDTLAYGQSCCRLQPGFTRLGPLARPRKTWLGGALGFLDQILLIGTLVPFVPLSYLEWLT